MLFKQHTTNGEKKQLAKKVLNHEADNSYYYFLLSFIRTAGTKLSVHQLIKFWYRAKFYIITTLASTGLHLLLSSELRSCFMAHIQDPGNISQRCMPVHDSITQFICHYTSMMKLSTTSTLSPLQQVLYWIEILSYGHTYSVASINKQLNKCK